MNYENILKVLNFEKLTPIQEGVIKAFDSNKNIVGLAPTGTGKTLAYLLPILSKIDTNSEHLQAIIVVPTNELVNQVDEMLRATKVDVRIKAYDARTDKRREQDWLSRNQPHIVIATPQKLLEFSTDNLLEVYRAKYFVMDEADMMFDYAFLSLIDQILNMIPNAKYLLFSASMNQNMEPFISKFFGDYIFVDTTKDHDLKITHMLIQSQLKTRLSVLEDIVSNLNPYMALIFVSRNEDQQVIYDALINKGLNVGMMSSKLSASQRRAMIKDINDLTYQYVIVSDLAARGLDFDISHVINYDLPYQLEFFKHRTGRTGRMNKEGIVITIALDKDSRKIQRLRKMGFDLNRYNITKDGFKKVIPREHKLLDVEIQAMRKVPIPKRVKPNYRKRNKERVQQAKRNAREKLYDKNR